MSIFRRPLPIPLLLLFFYSFTLFLPNISRYKLLVMILMLITAAIEGRKHFIRMSRFLICPPVLAMLGLVAAVIYGSYISLDPLSSFHAARKPVFIDGLAIMVMMPLLLVSQPKEQVAFALISGFTMSLLLLIGFDLAIYVRQIATGQPLLVGFEHRAFSDQLLLLVPFLLVAWHRSTGWLRCAFLALLLVAVLCMLGTMARGAWVAAAVVGGFWVVYTRAWRLALAVLLLVVTVAVCVKLFFADSMLAFKLTQTDSSERWGNGTQGAALDLILESPWRGYGFGNEIYHKIYNSRVIDYPGWFFDKSIGPHNMVLALWFSSGVFGLVAICTLCSVVSWHALRGMVTTKPGLVRDVIFALFLAFLGATLIRGMFEAVSLNSLGWLIALLAYFVPTNHEDQKVDRYNS